MTNHRLAFAASSVLALSSSPALAVGVGAGTLIDNTAEASFDNGGTTTTVQSNTVSVRVDELLDVAITSLGSGTTTLSGSTTVSLPFRVTNTGNGSEAYSLLLTTAIGGNSFDAVPQGIALDSNGNGVYDPGVDQLLGAGTATGQLAADTGLTVFALVALPSGTTDGATSQVRLTATAATGSGTAGTVFPGAGTSGSDAVVGSSTATSAAPAALAASSFTVTLRKSATITDPFGGTEPVPGAVVTYSIAADVIGSGTAQNLLVKDTIPTGTSYRASTLTLESLGLSDAVDADAGAASPRGIEVTLGAVTGGESRTVTFQVTIN